MALITLRVLDGADRGKVFEDLPTPVTVGREEGNVVQLNDERISRFHLKIQEDQDKIVITDLQSTNGTKVNGEEVQLRILRYGDIVSLGRTMLLFGSREEIAQRLAGLQGIDLTDGVVTEAEGIDPGAPPIPPEPGVDRGDPDEAQVLHTLLPPDLPEGLSPGQAAQVSELLQYLHLRLRGLITSVHTEEKGKKERVTLDLRQWQNLLGLWDRLARYLRAIGEPEQ